MTARTDLGTVQLQNSVVADIAANASREVPGVIGIWKAPWYMRFVPENISGVEVEISEQEVRINLALTAEYGAHLSQLALEVQDRVREMVEQMTQMVVVEVNVSIQEVKSRG
jgi:uncharacterized alkaline shock family protein YloU